MPKKRNCFNCGKLFTPSRKRNKYCCNDCGKEKNKKKSKFRYLNKRVKELLE